MPLRIAAVSSLIALATLVSGCVQERVVHDRPVIVEHRVVQRDDVEVVAPRPPPPRIEERVELRPGYVWSRSYWRWNGHDYVMVRGHWEPLRVGYHYVHPHWEQRGDGWHWRAGVWVAG